MALTEEQLRALLQMASSDIGGLEEDQTAIRNDANSARQMAQSIRGNDIGANLGRAGYGIGGAIRDYKGMQATPAIGAAKKKTFGDLIAGLIKKKEPALGGGLNVDEDPTMPSGY